MEVLHFWNDFSVFFALLGELLKKVSAGIIAPVRYSYNFLTGFTGNIGNDITATTTDVMTDTFSGTGTTSVMRVFNKLPYWDTFTTILGVAILILIGVAIIKLLTKI